MENDNNQELERRNRRAMMRRNLLERRSEARIIRRIVAIISIIIIIAIIVAAGGGYYYINSALKPVDLDSKKQAHIEVPIGSSATSIGKLLQKEGIIKNSTVFKYYVKFNNISGFQAGNYDLSPSMTLDEITETLQTGKLVREAVFKVTIPEGLQLNEIATIIAKHTDHSQEEILGKLANYETIEKLIDKYPDILTEAILDEEIKHPLEGYLFPATYSFYEEKPSIESIIDVMLKQTQSVISKYEEVILEKEVNIHSLLTMAALIEKEATAQADRHLISSVFVNRINSNMPLQTDPTIAYALGEHIERTLYEHLEVDSPYNTYKYKGLPPGPIANAGESSIEAALNPAESEYLYFLAEFGTGQVHYAKTLDEHNELKTKYITNKRDQAER